MMGRDRDVEEIPARKLMHAAAGLDPADRALLDLWMRQDLPDGALATAAGIPVETVSARKLDIVEHLGSRLRIPPYEVLASLRRAASREPLPRLPAAPVPAPELPIPVPVPAVRPAGPRRPSPELLAAELSPPLPPLPPVRLRRSWRW
jgi:hypothetical protein